ncbi:MAG: exonuclease SbcCD subunit D [Lachnospiraceae bacterium]|nr:exonuclease SbcCD subunit D [Lachnospiraceae bacterium]
MKFLHLADLHLGKKLDEFSMIEDQKYILLKILNIIDEEQPDGLIIAGDVYDKPYPSVEAVELLNQFLNALAQRKLETFIISGNHDSAERLSFASKLIDHAGIHIARAYSGVVTPFELSDKFGTVKLYLLPFVKPVHVRQAFPDEEIATYNDAVSTAINHMNINTDERNVLVTHQFVTGAKTCDSEEISVGGTDNIDASVFDGFDYVALGHIHSPQSITRDTLRYAGSPLKYSFSEAGHKKSVTVIELAQKGSVEISTIPLIPKHDLIELKGSYDTLMSKAFYENLNLDDYYHITLTDEEDILDAINRLRTVYAKILRLDYDNTRTRTHNVIDINHSVDRLQPIDLVNELYEKQNGQPLNELQREYAMSQIEKIWRGEA